MCAQENVCKSIYLYICLTLSVSLPVFLCLSMHICMMFHVSVVFMQACMHIVCVKQPVVSACMCTTYSRCEFACLHACDNYMQTCMHVCMCVCTYMSRRMSMRCSVCLHVNVIFFVGIQQQQDLRIHLHSYNIHVYTHMYICLRIISSRIMVPSRNA